MALTEHQQHIQDFLIACEKNSPVQNTGNPPKKTRDMVNTPEDHAELKTEFGMEDGNDLVYKNFWADFFDLASYIGDVPNPGGPEIGTAACCCSCCL